MKAFRAWALMLVAALAGCGDGGIQSPDFTPVLVSLRVVADNPNPALGETVNFQAIGTFTAPPGAPNETFEQVVADASWTSSNDGVVSVDSDGVGSTNAQGTATVTGESEGISGSTTIVVGAPRLLQLVITPPTATIALGATQTFRAQGIYTNSPDPQDVFSGTVSWVSQNPGVATVDPPQGIQTVATSQATGNVTITATTPNPQGGTLTANATLTVSNPDLNALLRVEPLLATIAKGNLTEFVAIGSFSDGTEQPLDDDQLDWTSSNTAVATIDAEGVATGVEQGQSTITAALKAGVPSGTANRSADATLNVTFAGCTVPLRASSGATVASSVGATCLLCNVGNEGAVIDDDDLTFGTLDVQVGLLMGAASITVTAPTATTFAAGEPAGFVIGRPVGQLLNAEVLSQLELSTLNDGQPTGDSTALSDSLGLTLLGQIVNGSYSADTALLAMDTTQPYDAVRLTFNSGLVTALTSVDVFAACGNAVVP